jgi:hypothetical protein
MYLRENMTEALVGATGHDLPEASVDELMLHAREDFSNATLELRKTTDGLKTGSDEKDREHE